MNDLDLVAIADPVSKERVPDAVLLSTALQAGTIMHLAGEELPVTRNRRRLALRLGIPVGVGLLAGGAVAATFLQASTPATLRNMVRCYSVGQLSTNTLQYTDTSMASSPGHPATDESASAAAAVSACSGLWQNGFIRPGAIGQGNSSAVRTVPRLVACVLPSGEAAVLPGNARTCRDLGLPDLAPRR